MDTLWLHIVQWLHSIGLHVDGSTARAVGEAAAQATAQMDTTSLLALAAALGWASGFRLYAVMFLTGLAGLMGWITLPPTLAWLQHPALLSTSGFMLFVEFFADKIPGLDSLWDLVQSVVRIPAGAALAASVFGMDNATMVLMAALMGGSLAATSQAAKMTSRAAINTSPEPFSNVLASLFEDGLVVGAVWLATAHPVVFGVLLAIAVVCMWVLTWVLFRFLRAVLRRVASFFSGTAKVA